MREYSVVSPVKERQCQKMRRGGKKKEQLKGNRDRMYGYTNVWGRLIKNCVMKLNRCGQDRVRETERERERGAWLNLGVRGHWSIWEPEIQVRNLKEEGRERSARRWEGWGPNRFCVLLLFMKMDTENTLSCFMNKSSIWQETAQSATRKLILDRYRRLKDRLGKSNGSAELMNMIKRVCLHLIIWQNLWSTP